MVKVNRRTSNSAEGAIEVGQSVVRRSRSRIRLRIMFRRTFYREQIANRGPGRTVGERGGKLRVGLPGVIPERRIADLVKVRRTFKGGIEDSPSGADTGRARLTEDFAQCAFVVPEGVSDAQTRREVVPPGGRNGTGNARIARKHPTRRGTREDHRLFTGNDGLNFVVLLIEGRADVIAHTVVDGQV